jgi:hypothetical protein
MKNSLTTEDTEDTEERKGKKEGRRIANICG